jgi:mannose-6-phosphate isomerase-like protein (cupin superfamily)
MMTRVLLLLMAVVASAAAQAPQPENGPVVLSQAKVYVHDGVPARKAANGSESINLLRGLLNSGESVAVHESMQPVGAEPVALHPIQHSELIVMREGEVMFDHDGKSEKAGPGDVIYVALGTVHRVRNVGNVSAKYVVVAIGGDTKR